MSNFQGDFSWKVYTRSTSHQRIGEVDDYSSLELVNKFNDVGAWVMEIDDESSQIPNLIADGNGILVTRNDEYYFSGPMIRYRQVGDANTSKYTITGCDDNVWLKRRLVNPSPAQSGPYNSFEFDVRTGVASTIMQEYVNWNLDNLATVPRRKGNFNMIPDPVIGGTVTGRGRWGPLLTILQELALAGGEIGFKVVQDDNLLTFTVYSPEDKTLDVRFSHDNENMTSYEYEVQQTDGNYVYVGGTGDGTARVIAEVADTESLAVVGRIEAEFLDGRDTNVVAELQAAGREWLAQNGKRASLAFVAVDTPNMAFGTHYNLGDVVSVIINGEIIQDVVREVTVKLDPEGHSVIPTVGNGRLEPLKVIKTLLNMKKRVQNLERRK